MLIRNNISLSVKFCETMSTVARIVFIFAPIVVIGIFLHSKISEPCTQRTSMSLKYWPNLKNMWNPNDNLRTLKRVFGRLGHERVNSSDESFDIFWYHELPIDELSDF